MSIVNSPGHICKHNCYSKSFIPSAISLLSSSWNIFYAFVPLFNVFNGWGGGCYFLSIYDQFYTLFLHILALIVLDCN